MGFFGPDPPFFESPDHKRYPAKKIAEKALNCIHASVGPGYYIFWDGMKRPVGIYSTGSLAYHFLMDKRGQIVALRLIDHRSSMNSLRLAATRFEFTGNILGQYEAVMGKPRPKQP